MKYIELTKWKIGEKHPVYGECIGYNLKGEVVYRYFQKDYGQVKIISEQELLEEGLSGTPPAR